MSIRTATHSSPRLPPSLKTATPPPRTHGQPPSSLEAAKKLFGSFVASGFDHVDKTASIPPKGVGSKEYPGAPVKPVFTGDAKPSKSNYNEVIDQFKVGSNPRYTPRDDGKKTFCNVFATDVMLAMGATTPTPPYSVNANQYADWLAKSGPAKGWKAISPEEAQKMANSGKPVVASWKNPNPGSGHIAVVRPGTYDPATGPATANAGKTNFDKGHAADGFKSGPISDIKYYVYDPKK